jgi:hypothetical protein
MRRKLGADLLIAGLGIPLQERLRAHHHSGDAIAALCGLLLHEGALDRRRLRNGAQAFERRHLLAFEQHQRRHAGQNGPAVDNHRAGATLAESATELRRIELQVVA